MYYTRGSMDDYNRWAKITGDPGWAWKNIFPYFLKVRSSNVSYPCNLLTAHALISAEREMDTTF